MKKNIFLMTAILAMLCFLPGCEKETIEQPKEVSIVEGDGLRLNAEQNIVELPSVSVTEFAVVDTMVYNEQDFPIYNLTIEGYADDGEQIKPGTVIYVPTGERGGQLIFVADVQEVENPGGRTNGKITAAIQGFQATLDMYFNYEAAKLEFSSPDNRSKTNSSISNKLQGKELDLGDNEISFSSKLAGLKIESSPDKLFKGTLGGNIWSSGKSYIRAEGSLSVHPAIDVLLQYEPVNAFSDSKLNNVFSGLLDVAKGYFEPDLALLFKDKNYFLGNMKQIQVVMYTDIDKDLTFTIHLEDGIKLNALRVPLTPPTFIPSYPVSTQLELSLEINLEATGILDLEVYKKDEFDVVLGVNMDRALDKIEWIKEFDHREDDGFTLKSKIKLAAGISLVLEAEVYVMTLAGPKISAEAFLEASAEVKAVAGTNDPLAINWQLSVDAGIRGDASLNLAAAHMDKFTWEIYTMAEVEKKKNIYLAPHHLVIEQGDAQTGVMGQALPMPVTVGAYDSKDNLITFLPVPVYFGTANGSTDPTGAVLTTDGMAETTWTLDATNTDQTLSTWFQVGEKKHNELTISATGSLNNPPTAPVLTAPANEAVDQDTTVILNWEASTDVEDDPVVYDVYLGTDEVPVSIVSAKQAEVTFDPSGLVNATIYYWKVVAKDASGGESESPVWSFTTIEAVELNTPPIAAVLTSPANNATGQALSPTLSWSASTDAEDDALMYDVYLGTTATPTVIISADQSGVSYSANGLANSSTYFWKVVTKDGNEGVTESSIWSFTTLAAQGLATLTTDAATSITETMATSGGNISADGGSAITVRGVCWSTSAGPTLTDGYSSDGGGTGSFSSSLTGLTAGTTYYVRAYATNSMGTAYGAEQSFTTANSSGGGTGTVTDIDGNSYQTVTIGTQEWMAENLKVTKTSLGTAINLVTADAAWDALLDSDNAYCYYDNNASGQAATYGALYTYAAALEACPTGWHLPTDEEWKTLEMYLGMNQSDSDMTGFRGTNQGTKIKAISGWNGGGNGTDDYGFSALPGGYRIGSGGVFWAVGNNSFWWSSTESSSSRAYLRGLAYNYSNVSRGPESKSYGMAVRCVKN